VIKMEARPEWLLKGKTQSPGSARNLEDSWRLSLRRGSLVLGAWRLFWGKLAGLRRPPGEGSHNSMLKEVDEVVDAITV
jgi:hypothetical protein